MNSLSISKNRRKLYVVNVETGQMFDSLLFFIATIDKINHGYHLARGLPELWLNVLN